MIEKIIQLYFDHHLEQNLSLSDYLRVYSIFYFEQNPFLSIYFYYLSYLSDLFQPNLIPIERNNSFAGQLTTNFNQLMEITYPTNEWLLILYFYQLIKINGFHQIRYQILDNLSLI